MMVLFIGGPLHLQQFPIGDSTAATGHFHHPSGSTYSLVMTSRGAVPLIGVCDDDQAGVEGFLRLISQIHGLHVS
jgi:hypothetical protein